MAFIFTVDLADPIPTQIFRRSGNCAITVHIGMDDDCPLSYSLVVGLAVSAGCDEFYFQLIEIYAETGEERGYWDAKEVGAIIMEPDRAKVLQVLLRVTRLLIKDARPDCFYCCTHGDNMPPQALEKYEAINEVFRASGYTVSLTSADRGRYSWWVERA